MDDITLTLTPREAAILSEMIRFSAEYAVRNPGGVSDRIAGDLAAVRDRITAAINAPEDDHAEHS